jgi:hypothetical protein
MRIIPDADTHDLGALDGLLALADPRRDGFLGVNSFKNVEVCCAAVGKGGCDGARIR